uniref:Beta-defensin n=1 Tax=Oryctolagus cuniculus TaxID=9986 RepID=A0A5F9DMR0_RABIT
MKIPILFVLFFFFVSTDTRVKCAMKDTYFCFVNRGKCRLKCQHFEKPVGFCTKLNANCCM